FSFKMHHRFSEPVKKWSNSSTQWLPKGSFEYCAVLAHRDRILRGCGLGLSEISRAPLAFFDGNSTFRSSSLGFLHYTTVQLGTPGVKFMVALDTGSDLFWVPCDCSRCASTGSSTYAFRCSLIFPLSLSLSLSLLFVNINLGSLGIEMFEDDILKLMRSHKGCFLILSLFIVIST
ncbi:Asp domain-containing protein, partial [Cephalotus follicularis]